MSNCRDNPSVVNREAAAKFKFGQCFENLLEVLIYFVGTQTVTRDLIGT